MGTRPPTLIPAILLLASAGCSSYTSPRLSVAETRVTDESDEGLVVSFTLDAENANAVPLSLRDVRYAVYLDGERVFSGYRSPEATLRRFGTQQLVLPAAVPLNPAEPRPTGSRTYRIQGSLTYITPGEIAQILFDSGVRKPSVGFTDEGRVDLTPTEP